MIGALAGCAALPSVARARHASHRCGHVRHRRGPRSAGTAVAAGPIWKRSIRCLRRFRPPRQRDAACRRWLPSRRWRSLRRMTPLDLKNGWTAQLGLGHAGKDGGPWILLYCLADYNGADQRPTFKITGRIPGEPLGPVLYSVSWSNARLEDQMLEMATSAVPRHGLYAALIPTAWKGTCHIRIHSPAGTLLVQHDLKITETAPCYWQTFASMDRDKNDDQFASVTGRTSAAIPSIGSTQIIVAQSTRQGEGTRPHGDAGKRLPAVCPCIRVGRPFTPVWRSRMTRLRRCFGSRWRAAASSSSRPRS